MKRNNSCEKLYQEYKSNMLELESLERTISGIKASFSLRLTTREYLEALDKNIELPFLYKRIEQLDILTFSSIKGVSTENAYGLQQLKDNASDYMHSRDKRYTYYHGDDDNYANTSIRLRDLKALDDLNYDRSRDLPVLTISTLEEQHKRYVQDRPPSIEEIELKAEVQAAEASAYILDKQNAWVDVHQKYNLKRELNLFRSYTILGLASLVTLFILL
jgi:hypothetical protein